MGKNDDDEGARILRQQEAERQAELHRLLVRREQAEQLLREQRESMREDNSGDNN